MTCVRFRPVLLSLCMSVAPVLAQNLPAEKVRVNLPPPAELAYTIKARQKRVPVEGDAVVRWTTSGDKFEVRNETRAMLVGKILDTKSVGRIDASGLLPMIFTEKRFRRDRTTTSFDRAAMKVHFAESQKAYPLNGGEQDRSSALWQLIGLARMAPSQVKPGFKWSFPVAGRSHVEPWTFKVEKQEKIRTPMGELSTVHIARVPQADSTDQKLDVWLAPSLEWYPVRLRMSEHDGDYIEQTLKEAKKLAH